MASGEQASWSTNPGDLELHVHGQPVNEELAQEQYDDLKRQLASTDPGRDEYTQENLRHRINALVEAFPELTSEKKRSKRSHHEAGNWWEAL